MNHDKNSVSRALNIELDVIGALCDGAVIGGKRVLGSNCRGTAVSNDERCATGGLGRPVVTCNRCDEKTRNRNAAIHFLPDDGWAQGSAETQAVHRC
jgi:hypothetical protein